MRAVTGPLQTGTYIAQLVDFPGEYAKVDDDPLKIGSTKEAQSTGTKWYLQKVGDDLYRCKHGTLDVAPAVLPEQGGVGLGGGTSDWIIKESDVKGEYYGGPAQHPSLFISTAKVEGDLKVNIGSGISRVRFFHADG